MNRTTRTRARWSINREAFQRLLEALDPDPDRAAQRFQALHSKLTLFFTYNRCANAEHWADESLDRVAKRLAEQQPVPDVNAYARGVARLVVLEAQKQEQRERDLLSAARYVPSQVHDEQVLGWLDHCLSGLSPDSRDLIFEYYSVKPSGDPAGRRKLAERLGITTEALRTRALRIRRELESCITRCREGEDILL